MRLSTTPDRRWMTHREDKRWYPTMRIFPKAEHMDWGSVFERMAAELTPMVPRRMRTLSAMVGIVPGELLDKIAIREIKAERIDDPSKAADRPGRAGCVGPGARSIDLRPRGDRGRDPRLRRPASSGRGSSSWRGRITRIMTRAR